MIEGLSFFEDTNLRDRWSIAVYHPPRSLTWRWILSFVSLGSGESQFWPLWHHSRDGIGGRLIWVRAPWIGFLMLQTQRPMWIA